MSEEQGTDQNEFEFRAEVQQVLSLVINSLYTHSEVFVRELISNASDALDKARLLQLGRDDVAEQQGEPAIDISLDADAKTLTIEDNGVGMTRDEVIENLGTVARSGTTEFLQKYKELGDKDKADGALELIGQFGVGFYSAFMAASRVDVQTLSMLPGAEPVLWRSTGSGSFTVLPGERETPGTRVVVHLKKDAEEFSRGWRVEQVIKKYSDFVLFPIRVDGEVANQSAALWRKPRAEVSGEQHAEFFRHVTGGLLGERPQLTIHYAVDAPVQFAALLYVPEKATPDLFMLQKQRPGLRLYAKRVLVMESCESLTPVYLRFLRGVVDSEDLSLNVSREMLQEDRTVQQIEQQLTKQALKALGKLAEENPERYETLWKQFGQVFKEGLATDWKNKDEIAALCRFESMNHEAGSLISLRQYADAKPAEQEAIYYLTGPSREQLERSPYLEVFRKRGRDVLLLCDPIDEWVVKALPEYDKLAFRSVAHGDIDLEPDGDKAAEGGPDPDAMAAVVDAVRKALGDKVDDVRISRRLTETASCLVSKEGDPSANLDRLLKLMDEGAQQHKRVLEINPGHALVENLATVVARDPGSSHVELWARMLYDQALLVEGVVEDPAELVGRIDKLLVEVSGRVASK